MSEYISIQPSYAVERDWKPQGRGGSIRLANYRQSQRAASNLPPADEDDEDTVALAALKPSAPVAKVAPAAADPMVTLFATTAAVAAERKRMAEVFSSEHSRGRERGCIALLTSEKGWTATAILAELPNLPMDGATSTTTAAGRARANDRWARAYGSKSEPLTAPKAKTSDQRWARANAKIGRSA